MFTTAQNVRLVGLLFLTCSGCTIPMFEHPLVSPADAKAFPNLHGAYRTTVNADSDKSVLYAHVGPAGDDFPPGFLRIISVGQPKDGKSKIESTSLVGFVEPVGKYHILHVPLPKTPDEKPPKAFWDQKWDPADLRGYMLLRLSVADERIEVASMNAVFVADAIAAKRLDGNDTLEHAKRGGVIEINNRKIEVTANTEDLRKFFARHIDDGLFEKPISTFSRIDP